VRDATQNRLFVFEPPDPKPVMDFIWFQATSLSTTVSYDRSGVVLCGVEMSESDGEDSGKEGVYDVQHYTHNIHCTTYTTLQTLLRTALHRKTQH
jgi:hypothetical protein